MTIAKENKVSSIKAYTWLFFEHPKIASKLGFKLEKGTDTDYLRILREQNIIKIIGDNFQRDGPGHLIGINKNNDIIEIPINSMKIWPTWIKVI